MKKSHVMLTFAISILICNIFVTVAYAGLFDVIGTIVGVSGTANTGVSNEQFMAAATKTLTEKGDSNDVLRQMEHEYAKYGYQIKSENPENEKVRIYSIAHPQLNFNGILEINRYSHTITLQQKLKDGQTELRKSYSPTQTDSTLSVATISAPEATVVSEANVDKLVSQKQYDGAEKPSMANGGLQVLSNEFVVEGSVYHLKCKVKNVSNRALIKATAQYVVRDKNGVRLGTGVSYAGGGIQPGEIFMIQGFTEPCYQEGATVILMSIDSY